MKQPNKLRPTKRVASPAEKAYIINHPTVEVKELAYMMNVSMSTAWRIKHEVLGIETEKPTTTKRKSIRDKKLEVQRTKIVRPAAVYSNQKSLYPTLN